jgi:hypothetical protein
MKNKILFLLFLIIVFLVGIYVVSTFNKNRNIYERLDGYNLSEHEIEYDIYNMDEDDKKYKSGKKICRYAQPPNGEKSILPKILQKVLKGILKGF